MVVDLLRESIELDSDLFVIRRCNWRLYFLINWCKSKNKSKPFGVTVEPNNNPLLSTAIAYGFRANSVLMLSCFVCCKVWESKVTVQHFLLSFNHSNLPQGMSQQIQVSNDWKIQCWNTVIWTGYGHRRQWISVLLGQRMALLFRHYMALLIGSCSGIFLCTVWWYYLETAEPRSLRRLGKPLASGDIYLSGCIVNIGLSP